MEFEKQKANSDAYLAGWDRIFGQEPKEAPAVASGYIRFRKKPVEITAAQWFKNGDHPEDNCELIAPVRGEPFFSEGAVVRYFRRPGVLGSKICQHCNRLMHDHGWIDTMEGGHIVCPGDWIITGVKGERYPCKPDIFAQTYEPAE